MLSVLAVGAAVVLLGVGVQALTVDADAPMSQPGTPAREPLPTAVVDPASGAGPADGAASEGSLRADEDAAVTGTAAGRRVTIDPAWLAETTAATGIPPRALRAYATADLVIESEQPSCAIGWNTLAAIGGIESDHGRHGGAVLGEDGRSSPAIFGPALDGDGVAAIADTDGGRWDGDTTWDRAVGPLQFIPDTWTRWGADGDGDGTADPHQLDDAALAAARYLCASSTMTDAAGWRRAVFAYNHLDAYVDDVAALANRYAAATG